MLSVKENRYVDDRSESEAAMVMRDMIALEGCYVKVAYRNGDHVMFGRLEDAGGCWVVVPHCGDRKEIWLSEVYFAAGAAKMIYLFGAKPKPLFDYSPWVEKCVGEMVELRVIGEYMACWRGILTRIRNGAGWALAISGNNTLLITPEEVVGASDSDRLILVDASWKDKLNN